MNICSRLVIALSGRCRYLRGGTTRCHTALSRDVCVSVYFHRSVVDNSAVAPLPPHVCIGLVSTMKHDIDPRSSYEYPLTTCFVDGVAIVPSSLGALNTDWEQEGGAKERLEVVADSFRLEGLVVDGVRLGAA